MELPTVSALCVAIALCIVKANAAPVGGLLSGLFGGDDGHIQQNQSPVDINQLLRQYYTAQSEDAMSRYNPFGALGGPYSYGQPTGPQSYDPYSQLNSGYGYNPYQQPQLQQQQFFPPGYPPQDPYSQFMPLSYRAAPAQLPLSVDDSSAAASAVASASAYNKQLEGLLPVGAQDAHLFSDLSSYRSLADAASASANAQADQVQAQADSDASAQASAQVQDRLQVPLASSLVAHRMLAEDKVSPKALTKSSVAAAPRSAEAASLKE